MRTSSNWYKLDNAAQMIPASVAGADTRVFRLSCELYEDVEPEILQEALDVTMQLFPHMACCLRKGVFWYYLDTLPGRPLVTEENLPPLSQIYIPGRKNYLFRISWYKKRINVEFFHVLTDGTGGFAFLSHLVGEYLIRRHGLNEQSIPAESASVLEKQQDAFSHFYQKDTNRGEKLPYVSRSRAYHLRLVRDPDLREHLIEGTVSASAMLETARHYGTTIGVLCTAVYIESIIQTMRVSDYRREVVISVPVNLRQYFPSATARNFFGTIQIRFDPQCYDGTLESILPVVAAEFKAQLTKEKISASMYNYAQLEHRFVVRMVPLPLKDLVLGIAMSRQESAVTSSVSNVGKVSMPEIFTPYIRKFSAFMACRSIFLVISTFADNMVFGITSCYEKHPLEMHFFRRLVSLGIDVEIASSDYNAESGDDHADL